MTLSRLTPLLLSALLALMVMAVPADAARAKRSSVCGDTRSAPAAGNLAAVERATVCLLNQERERRGLRELRIDHRLARAADRHVADMVARGYFGHYSRDGRSFSDRIRATGYLSGVVGSWSVGENLAWGSGAKGGAAEIVAAWMRSTGHRANILNGRYREIGIGVTLGNPRGGDGATYATEFGAVVRRASAARR